MADAMAKDTTNSVTPAEVARQRFELERRGFDQQQVRAYLIAVADALRDAQAREAEMRSRLGKAVRRAERAEAVARDLPASDPSSVTRQVGDEVTAVLDAARAAGEQKIAAAEKSAESLLANAKREASDVRKAADSIMEVRRAEADAVADELVQRHRLSAEQLVATAQSDADTLRRDAAADLDRVRTECDHLIREAEEARAQILLDMERRRRQARAQVERLRVGRDRLLRSYEVVRRTLDESTTELKSSLKEAKVLGDTAARTAAAEPLREPAQLEAELADRAMISEPSSPRRGPSGGSNRSGRGHGGAAQATGEAGAKPQVPHVDMRPGAFADEVAPTPKHPARRRPTARDTSVPATPIIAPQIKAPTPTPADTEAIAQVRAGSPGARSTPVARRDEAALESDSSATATIVLDVPSLAAASDVAEERHAESSEPATTDDEATPAVADSLEAEVLDAALVAEVAPEADGAAALVAEVAPAAVDDFSDLPQAELAVVIANDEIEEVVALDPEQPTAAIEAPVIDADEVAGTDEAAGAGEAVVADADEVVDGEAVVADADEVVDGEAVVADADEAVEVDAEAMGLFAALRAHASAEATSASCADTETVDRTTAVDDTITIAGDACVAHNADESGVADIEPEVDTAMDVDLNAPAGFDDAAPDSAARDDAAGHDAAPDDAVALTGAVASAESQTEDARDAARDAAMATAATDLCKRLKRALADEQNDVLAGIRAAGRRSVDLISLVGETDDHIRRYVQSITTVAAEVYAMGAQLEAGDAPEGEMPAGAVEELIGSIIVLPIRLRLIELDTLDVERAAVHVDAVRAFYRQRKTNHLDEAAEALASLLMTAGACDALPAEAAVVADA